MQEEAVKRVREMQKRSRSIVNGDNKEAQEKTASQAPPPPSSVNGAAVKRRPDPIHNLIGGLMGGNASASNKGELFNIGGIKIDEEKAMIGLLIYILYKQGSDVKLLLALGYLLL